MSSTIQNESLAALGSKADPSVSSPWTRSPKKLDTREVRVDSLATTSLKDSLKWQMNSLKSEALVGIVSSPNSKRSKSTKNDLSELFGNATSSCESPKFNAQGLNLQQGESHKMNPPSRAPRPNLLESGSTGPRQGRSGPAGRVIRFNNEEQKQIAAERKIQVVSDQETPKVVKISLSPKTQSNVAKDQREFFKASRKASPFVYRKVANFILEKMKNPTPRQMKVAKYVGYVVSALSVVGGLNDFTRKAVQKVSKSP